MISKFCAAAIRQPDENGVIIFMFHAIPVIGFYADPHELILAGTSNDLPYLARALVLEPPSQQVLLHVPDDNPAPYQGFIKGIQIVDTPHRIQIQRREDLLIVNGALRFRRELAYELMRIASRLGHVSTFIEKHIRIYHYLDHPFLEPSSHMLVISIVGAALSETGEKKVRWLDEAFSGERSFLIPATPVLYLN